MSGSPITLALEACCRLIWGNRSLYFLKTSGLGLSEKYRFVGVQMKLELDSRSMSKNVNSRYMILLRIVTKILKFLSNVTSRILGRMISFRAQKNRRIFLFQNFATVFGVTMLHFACYSHYFVGFGNEFHQLWTIE